MHLRYRLVLLASAVIAAFHPSATKAQAPFVEPGECLYLVGAPAGAAAALTEVTVSEVGPTTCDQLITQVDLNRDGANMVQAWIVPPGTYDSSRAFCSNSGRVGHEFQVPATFGRPALSEVTMSGSFRGAMELPNFAFSVGSSVRVKIRFLEVPPSGPSVMLDEKVVLDERLPKKSRHSLESTFAARLVGWVRPGARYRLELDVRLYADSDLIENDFGRPGAGGMVSYDSIEVCVHSTETGEQAATLDLERDLYEGRLMPGLWLPVANGGHLEDARSLVFTRISQAAVAPAPGVNTRLAVMRLASADLAASRGDYQGSARLLSQSLRALTTP